MDHAGGEPHDVAALHGGREGHAVHIAADDLAGVAVLAGGTGKGGLHEPGCGAGGKQGAVVVQIFAFDQVGGILFSHLVFLLFQKGLWPTEDEYSTFCAKWKRENHKAERPHGRRVLHCLFFCGVI